MGRDEGVEIASAHVNLATELTESNPALVTVILELTGADPKFFAHLF